MARDLRLGLNVGYWGAGPPPGVEATIAEAEQLGFDSLWTAEAYGSDVLTPLAWWGSRTTRLRLGTAIVQLSARAPTATAMAAMTMDHLSGGRFILGLGVSGPQVVEGWYGRPFAKPLARTREYVEIVRMALRREKVQYAGRHFTLPLPDGPGKALRLTIRPPRADLPIYLAAVGPRNLQLAGEVADGWLGIFLSPEHSADQLAAVRSGREAAGAGAPGDVMAGFDVVASVPVVVTDDLEAARAALADYTALYIGGMGSREQNFYNALARRMGFEAEAEQVQNLYLDKQYLEAAMAIPRDFIDSTSLIGPFERVRDRLQAYADAGVTTLSISPFAPDLDARIGTLRKTAEALAAAGLAE